MLATTLATLALAAMPQLAQAVRPDADSVNGGWDQLRIVNKRWQLHTTLASPTASVSNAGSGSTLVSAAPDALQTQAYSSAPLTSPPPPADLPDAMTVRVFESADAHVAAGNALSVRQPGNFLGYSIELSVANQVLGPSSIELRAPFLNYLQNLRARTQSGARVRIGGNSQEGSVMYPTGELPNGGNGGSFLEKAESTATITNTPDVLYTEDLIYAMSNTTALVNTQWVFGAAFINGTVDGWDNPLHVVDFVEAHLGDNLIGIQLSNEPDLYPGRRRNDTYTKEIWFQEVGDFLANELEKEPNLPQLNNFFLPNFCCNWFPFEAMDMQLIETYGNRMNTLSYQHYPYNNCGDKDPSYSQEVFQDFLNHTLALSLTPTYTAALNQAIEAGLQTTMLETNTASCSGLAGLSDSFGGALWTLDWSLTQAAINFTSSYMHVGGRDAHYNPFTAVQTNQSTFRGWTTGPVYYTSLIAAEIFGSSNASQISDITPEGSIYNPVYVVYEDNVPTKVALFNYVTDPTGGSNVNVALSVGGITEGTAATTPSQVFVRYWASPSAGEQFDMTWAGQSAGAGGPWTSDGTLKGEQQTITVDCPGGTCSIPLNAPSFALVFLSQAALDAVGGTVEAIVDGVDQSATTFATTYNAGGVGTATVAQEVLETSNGRVTGGHILGSTSKGNQDEESTASRRSVLGGLAASAAGALAVAGFFLTS